MRYICKFYPETTIEIKEKRSKNLCLESTHIVNFMPTEKFIGFVARNICVDEI